MSIAGEDGFGPALRELDRELALPVPVRLRILRELAQDLEGLRGYLEARGHSPAAARDRAMEALVPDGGAALALTQLHRSRYSGLRGRVGPAAARAVDRGVFVLLAVCVLAGEAMTLLRAGLLDDPSPYLMPVLGLGALGVTLSAVAALQFRMDGTRGATRSRLRAVLALSATTALAGLGGALVESYLLFAALEASGGPAAPLLVPGMERVAGLLAAGLVLCLAGGLGWFVVNQWTSGVFSAHHHLLGLQDERDLNMEEIQ